MNIIKKMILFIKNIFASTNEVKKLQEPKFSIEQEGQITFIEHLKITTTEKKKKVETLICHGDGLGIQKNITC